MVWFTNIHTSHEHSIVVTDLSAILQLVPSGELECSVYDSELIMGDEVVAIKPDPKGRRPLKISLGIDTNALTSPPPTPGSKPRNLGSSVAVDVLMSPPSQSRKLNCPLPLATAADGTVPPQAGDGGVPGASNYSAITVRKESPVMFEHRQVESPKRPLKKSSSGGKLDEATDKTAGPRRQKCATCGVTYMTKTGNARCMTCREGGPPEDTTTWKLNCVVCGVQYITKSGSSQCFPCREKGYIEKDCEVCGRPYMTHSGASSCYVCRQAGYQTMTCSTCEHKYYTTSAEVQCGGCRDEERLITVSNT